MSKDEAGDRSIGMVLERRDYRLRVVDDGGSSDCSTPIGIVTLIAMERTVLAHTGSVAWQQAGLSHENHARRGAVTAIHRPPGWGRDHRMIDGDHVAQPAIHGHAGPFEEDAGLFSADFADFADFAGSALPDQPDKESIEAIPSLPQRRGATLAGA
jgi:hypothetical protein